MGIYDIMITSIYKSSLCFLCQSAENSFLKDKGV